MRCEDWKPREFSNGWRAVQGTVVDGRLWRSEVQCRAYCDGIAQGWRDATGESASGPLAALLRERS